MNDHLSDLRLFVQVAKSGSFTAAGRALRVPQPTVSRAVARVEADVGATLLVRTTRAVALTDVGADFLLRVEPLLAGLDEAAHAARGSTALRGTLRLAVSSSFGARVIVPLLPSFTARHPRLSVQLQVSDRRQDLVVDGVDIAFRLGVLDDSSTAVAKKLATLSRQLAAAPSYLKKRGVPKQPRDLVDHDVIGFGAASSPFVFVKDKETVKVRVGGRLSADANELAVVAACHGLGVVHSSAVALRPLIDDGALVAVLADWDIGAVDVHAVFAAGRAASPAARAFADHVKAAFDRAPPGTLPQAKQR